MSREVLAFDLNKNEMQSSPDMICSRINHGCTSLGDFFFVFGGKRGLLVLNTIEILTVAAAEWKLVNSDGSLCCYLPVVAAVGRDKILIGGGNDRTHLLAIRLLFVQHRDHDL